MNEATIERVAKHMAAFNGDPDARGAYAHQAMEVIDLAEDRWEPIETAPKDEDSSQEILVWDDWRQEVCRFFGFVGGKPMWFNGDMTVAAKRWRPLPKPPKT